MLTGTPSTPPVLVDKFIRYTGTGVNPIAIELMGINRAHYVMIIRRDLPANKAQVAAPPHVLTGTSFNRRDFEGGVAAGTDFDAPPPGVSQMMTMHNNFLATNENGKPYRIHVQGEPV